MTLFDLAISFAMLWFIDGIYCWVMMTKLKVYPEAFKIAGSPSPFGNKHREWQFLLFVLKGNFTLIPDKKLVTSFKVFRIFEVIKLVLFIGLFLGKGLRLF